MIELLRSSPATLSAVATVVGLIVGSFLNVVIHRLPRTLAREWRSQALEVLNEWGQDKNAPETVHTASPALAQARTTLDSAPRYNLVVPRSACPHCQAPITAWQNIPLISWLALRGRCAKCAQPISARYPLVELLTGVMSAAVAWRFGFGWPALAALVLTWFLVALTFIDIDRQLLPDSLTLPLLWLGLLLSLWGGGTNGAFPVDVRSSLIGAMAGYVSLWSVYHLFRLVTGKDGMGYGDFKLLAALGAWLGWKMLLPVVLFAAVVGAIVGIAVLSLRGQKRSTPIAFGPFLAAAGWLILLFGPRLVAEYLGWFSHP